MKTTHIFYSVLFVFLLSCGKDDDKDPQDTTAPTIVSVLLEGSSEEVVLEGGETLDAEILITDNEALHSAKVEIHHAGDGHSHRKLAEVEFEYMEIIALDGVSEQVELQIPVPMEAEHGEYHFTVQAIDAAGNESGLFVAEFEIMEHTTL